MKENSRKNRWIFLLPILVLVGVSALIFYAVKAQNKDRIISGSTSAFSEANLSENAVDSTAEKALSGAASENMSETLSEVTSDPASESSSEASSSEASSSEAPSSEALPSETEEGVETIRAMFSGVQDYGKEQTKKENAEQFHYIFLVDGEEEIFTIDNSELDAAGNSAFVVQNKLKENYYYDIKVKDGVIIDAIGIEEMAGDPYEPVVEGIPGEKTVLNFVKTSLMPVGTTLYVFGGGWDWQDTGSAIQARTLGVSEDWVRFFNEHDEYYTFRDVDDDKSKRDPTTSYYPFGGYNEYYYAGLDCSGFVGWTIYNTFETENGKEGYVGSSTQMAKRFSEYGWGSFTQDVKAPSQASNYTFLPGDIMSMNGHVWISLGTCSDGSVLIVHSTNGVISRKGQPGGGVSLGAIAYSKDCEAYRLADEYMSKYYPEWYSRYEVHLCDPDAFYKASGEYAGLFRWDTESREGLSDPDHVQDMTPEEVLKLCFGE